MTTDGRREGFVGWISGALTNDSWTRQYRRVYVGDIGRDDALTPVYVVPLDPDGPKPGETWVFNGREVEIVRPSNVERDGSVASWWVRDPNYNDLVWLRIRDLTRAPETREIHVTIAEPGAGQTSAKFRVDARDKPADLMAAIRGAVEVDNG